MNVRSAASIAFFAATCMVQGCANITTPTGGKKDTIPPKLLAISPADSLRNTRVSRIEMHFDEYITVNDVSRELFLSPILPVQPTMTGTNKHVVVKIVDSLLEENTTYRLSFGNSIKDLHEGNAFKGYTYTFSTGSYFDSLELSGNVIDASTGQPDTGAVRVVLYYASAKDSAVVKQKPKYVITTDASGNFKFKGLPHRAFRIYAMKDKNDNLIYDGPGAEESIAFQESTVMPGDSTAAPIALRLFREHQDTTIKKTDTAASSGGGLRHDKGRLGASAPPAYSVTVDTSNPGRKTYDITQPVKVTFALPPNLNKDKISLFYYNDTIQMPAKISIRPDSLNPKQINIYTDWKENTKYILKLAKGFAKDTGGADLMPSKYIFRTMEEDDYGKIQVNLPGRYRTVAGGAQYVLLVKADKDTVYQKVVTDTVVKLTRLKAGQYSFRVIADKNKNGKWDTGDLFGKLQPEVVIPYYDVVKLKASWEYAIDFDQKPEPLKKRADGKK